MAALAMADTKKGEACRPFQFTLRHGIVILSIAVATFAFIPFPIRDSQIRAIRVGMTPREVVDVLGRPHEQHLNGNVNHWFYHSSLFGRTLFSIRFKNGHVATTWTTPPLFR